MNSQRGRKQNETWGSGRGREERFPTSSGTSLRPWWKAFPSHRAKPPIFHTQAQTLFDLGCKWNHNLTQLLLKVKDCRAIYPGFPWKFSSSSKPQASLCPLCGGTVLSCPLEIGTTHSSFVRAVPLLKEQQINDQSTVLPFREEGRGVPGPSSAVLGPGSAVPGPGSAVQGPGSAVRGPAVLSKVLAELSKALTRFSFLLGIFGKGKWVRKCWCWK